LRNGLGSSTEYTKICERLKFLSQFIQKLWAECVHNVFDVKLNSTSNGGSFKGNMRQKMSTAIYLW
jgi:hypothetical protein